jgi:hypothetical protein
VITFLAYQLRIFLESNINLIPDIDILQAIKFRAQVTYFTQLAFSFLPYIISLINIIIYYIVSYSVNFEKHFTRSMMEASKIAKLCVLLVLNTVISPYFSLLMTTIADSSEKNDFLSPYFFFNIISNRIYIFLISSLFLSKGLSYFYLIFTDIFYFFYNLLYYRYKNGYFRNVSIERTEFPFIENYTNILVIFCLVITYGIFIFKKRYNCEYCFDSCIFILYNFVYG